MLWVQRNDPNREQQMTTVYAIHKPDPDHLAEVTKEMRHLGAPTIEVVDCCDFYQALEGSHRLAAAANLRLVPHFIVHAQDEVLDLTHYDWFDEMGSSFTEPEYTAGEVAGELFSPYQAVDYRFADQ
jgi:hypothetical protein